jgi:hypothetical protein
MELNEVVGQLLVPRRRERAVLRVRDAPPSRTQATHLVAVTHPRAEALWYAGEQRRGSSTMKVAVPYSARADFASSPPVSCMVAWKP